MKLFGKYRNIREMLENESAKELAMKFPHGRPTTRRDLLKSGAISFAASMTLPSLTEILLKTNVAYAQTAASCANAPKFIGLKANGGRAMMGDWVPLGANRDFIETYSQLGLGSRSEIAANSTPQFGNALFWNASPLLAGITATAQASTLANTTMIGIPCASGDDSANNPFDVTHFLTKFGVVGSILPNLGRSQTLTGIAQLPAFGKAPPTPLPVGSITDLSNALTVAGSLNVLNEQQKTSLFRTIQRLSDSEARRIAADTGGALLGQLVEQATGTNTSLAGASTAGIDPLQDTAASNVIGQTVTQRFNTIWQTAGNQNMQNQNINNRERVFGTMVYNALKGNAGTVNLDMGGYDYHGQGQATRIAQDTALGRIIGQALESAAAMQTPVMIMVTSDGAVGMPAGSGLGAAPTSDRGQGGAIHIYAYHPTARPAATNSAGRIDHQVGQVAGQAAVDQDFVTGNSPEYAGLAAFANFASFTGNLAGFFTVAGNIWNQDQVDQVVRLRPAG